MTFQYNSIRHDHSNARDITTLCIFNPKRIDHKIRYHSKIQRCHNNNNNNMNSFWLLSCIMICFYYLYYFDTNNNNTLLLRYDDNHLVTILQQTRQQQQQQRRRQFVTILPSVRAEEEDVIVSNHNDDNIIKENDDDEDEHNDIEDDVDIDGPDDDDDDIDNDNDNDNDIYEQPNILLLITDDQDIIIGGMDSMNYLKYMIETIYHNYSYQIYTNSYVHTPICCPSRSSILTGQYIHNGINIINNSITGNCNGVLWQNTSELYDTFAIYAQQYGYITSYSGKYLNQYNGTKLVPQQSENQSSGSNNSNTSYHVPRGWDYWFGLVGNSVYYNYSIIQSNDNGNTSYHKSYGDVYVDDYLPDVVTNRTIQMIHQYMSLIAEEQETDIDDNDDQIKQQSETNNNGKKKKQNKKTNKKRKKRNKRKPFLFVNAWPSPHEPFTSAPWAQHKYNGYNAYRTPNYNASFIYMKYKHWLLRRLTYIDNSTESWIDQTFQYRLETLVSIDYHIYQFIQLLEYYNIMNNTIIIYMSDNGFQLGQHRLQTDKRHLYEHDIRIPFVTISPYMKNTTHVKKKKKKKKIKKKSKENISRIKNIKKNKKNGTMINNHDDTNHMNYYASYSSNNDDNNDIRMMNSNNNMKNHNNFWTNSHNNNNNNNVHNKKSKEQYYNHHVVLNIDIAPTIYELITGQMLSNLPKTNMDGISFARYLTNHHQLLYSNNNNNSMKKNFKCDDNDDDIINYYNHDDFLISYNGEGNIQCNGMAQCPIVPPSNDHGGGMPDSFNNTYRCVRTIHIMDDDDDNNIDDDCDDNNNNNNSDNNSICHNNNTNNDDDPKQIVTLGNNTMYCHFHDNENFVEYYDLNNDPYQLHNKYNELSSEQRIYYEMRLQQLLNCSGDSCRRRHSHRNRRCRQSTSQFITRTTT